MKQIMKILPLVFLLLGLSAGTLFAQEDEEENPLSDSEYATYKEKFNLQERLFVGGGVNFGFTNEQLNLGMTPFVGLRLTDQFHMATGLNYSYVGLRFPGYKGSFNSLDYRLFARYLLINFETIGKGIKREPGDPLGGLYAHVEYSKNFLNRKKENVSSSIVFVVPNQSFFVGAGYQQNFYRGFGYFAEIVYDVLQANNDQFGWPIDLRFGLYYGF